MDKWKFSPISSPAGTCQFTFIMVSIHHNKQNKGWKIKIFVLVPSDVTDTADDESQLSEENSVSQRLIQLQKRLEIEQKVGQIHL